MNDTNVSTNNYETQVVNENKKVPAKLMAFLSAVMAIGSATAIFIVGILTLAIVLATLFTYGVSILALVLIPVFCLIPLPFSIAAIVCAKMAKNKGNQTAWSKVGFILGIITTAYWGAVNVIFYGSIILFIVAIILLVVFGGALGILGTVLTGILGILGSLVAVLTPVLTLLAGVFAILGEGAINNIFAYLYEFLKELFNTYVVNGAAIIGMFL